MKRSSYLVPTLILFIFLYFLYEYRVFEKLSEIASRLRPEYLIASLSFYLLTYLTRAKRFSLMFSRISTPELSAVMAVHTFLNNLLPFRSGEASFPVILKKLFGIETAISSAALMVVRLLDLLSLSFLFTISLFAVAFDKKELLWIPGILTAVTLLILLAAFKLIKKLKNRFTVIGSVFLFFQNFISFKTVIMLTLYSLLTWMFKFMSFFFILKAGGIKLNYFQTVFVSTFGEITTILPIHSFGGFGTYEAGLVGGFSLLGIKGSYALTVAFYFHLILLVMSAVLAFIGWLYLLRRASR